MRLYGQSQFTSLRLGQRIGPEQQLLAAFAQPPAQYQQRAALEQFDLLHGFGVDASRAW